MRGGGTYPPGRFPVAIIIIEDPFRSNMPIVSINLSPTAYMIYDHLAKTRKASSIVSQVLVNWDQGETPMLQDGDMRRGAMGELLVWIDGRWNVREESE